MRRTRHEARICEKTWLPAKLVILVQLKTKHKNVSFLGYSTLGMTNISTNVAISLPSDVFFDDAHHTISFTFSAH